MPKNGSSDLKKRARELAAAEAIPYSAALARLRDGQEQQAPPARRTWILPEYLYVPFPAPDLRGAKPCDACEGSGLSGLNWAMESDGVRPPLLVEGVCSSCLGCGRAEHDYENGCGWPHADSDSEYADDSDPDGPNDWDEEPELLCRSCHGRRFNYTQGFALDDDGEPAEVVYTRAPCGCTAGQVRIITGDPVEVTA